MNIRVSKHKQAKKISLKNLKTGDVFELLDVLCMKVEVGHDPEQPSLSVLPSAWSGRTLICELQTGCVWATPSDRECKVVGEAKLNYTTTE